MAAPLLTFEQIGKRTARHCRRRWTNTTHAENIRQSINDAMDEMSRFAAWPFRMSDTTLSLGSPGAPGTKTYALPDNFGYIGPLMVRSSDHKDPLIYVGADFVVERDPDWSDQGSPDYWGILGREFFFWPRVSATWATTGTIYYAYSRMLTHVAESGTASDSTEYSDAGNPDCPAHYHEALVDGAAARELDIRLGPGAGDRHRTRWCAFLERMAGKTDVIGGGGSPTIRYLKRHLVGSSFRSSAR